MKPTTKPKRTAEQQREEAAVHRQHASAPIQARPAGTINQESFAAILSLMQQFKSLRESQGLTLAEVAKRMEMNEAGLSQLENGKMLNPTLATLYKWAQALGQRMDIVLTKSSND